MRWTRRYDAHSLRSGRGRAVPRIPIPRGIASWMEFWPGVSGLISSAAAYATVSSKTNVTLRLTL